MSHYTGQIIYLTGKLHDHINVMLNQIAYTIYSSYYTSIIVQTNTMHFEYLIYFFQMVSITPHTTPPPKKKEKKVTYNINEGKHICKRMLILSFIEVYSLQTFNVLPVVTHYLPVCIFIYYVK